MPLTNILFFLQLEVSSLFLVSQVHNLTTNSGFDKTLEVPITGCRFSVLDCDELIDQSAEKQKKLKSTRLAPMIGNKSKVLLCALSALVAIVAVVAAIVDPVCAGDVLDGVKAQGRLLCGVSGTIPGFSERDATGKRRGFNVDFCHAVIAAVLGDAAKVDFVPLTASMRFPALQSGKIHLLVHNTSWTLTREALLKVQFPAVLFYDSQAMLVPANSGIGTIEALNGATVCVEKDTTHVQNMKDYFNARELSVNPVVIDSASDFAAALSDGRCTACTADASQLAVTRLQSPGGPLAFKVLPERISKEPLCPVVWGGDPEWVTIVRWVFYALILASAQCRAYSPTFLWLPLRW